MIPWTKHIAFLSKFHSLPRSGIQGIHRRLRAGVTLSPTDRWRIGGIEGSLQEIAFRR